MMNQRVLLAATWLLVAALIVLMLLVLKEVLSPFLIALLFAYLLNPVVDKLSSSKISRTLAVSFILFFFCLLLSGFVLLLLPIVFEQTVTFINQLPEYVHWLQLKAAALSERYLDKSLQAMDVEPIKQALADNWQSASGKLAHLFSGLSQSTLSFFAALANIALIPVLSFYFMRDWPQFLTRLQSLLPIQSRQTVLSLSRQCDDVLSAFIRGQLVVMAVLAVVYAIGLSMVGIDLAIALGLLAGLASIVPYLGVIVGVLSASLAAYLQFTSFAPLLGVGIVFMFGQLLEGMVLTPILVGDKIGLHPVIVIFVIMAGGSLAGFTGVLLALPVSAVLMVLLKYAIGRYKQSPLFLGLKKT